MRRTEKKSSGYLPPWARVRCAACRCGDSMTGFRRQHKAEGVRHSGMPGRGTRHLRSVVGNEHAVEAVAVQDRENADHVHVALVDECFAVVRHLPHDVAKMNIGNLALFAVLIYCVVNIAFGHFGESSHAKLQGIAAAGSEINQPLIHVRLVNEARLLPHGRHGRIVGVGRQLHA